MRISDWSSDVCSSDLTCAGDLMNTQKGKAAPLWTPTPQRCADSNLAHYMAWLAQRGLCFADYAALQRWSTTELEAFWASVWEYFDVCSRTPYQRSEEHTSELQSLMRISYAVFCLKKKKKQKNIT